MQHNEAFMQQNYELKIHYELMIPYDHVIHQKIAVLEFTRKGITTVQKLTKRRSNDTSSMNG